MRPPKIAGPGAHEHIAIRRLQQVAVNGRGEWRPAADRAIQGVSLFDVNSPQGLWGQNDKPIIQLSHDNVADPSALNPKVLP